jgi:hypothetical protein
MMSSYDKFGAAATRNGKAAMAIRIFYDPAMATLSCTAVARAE